MHYDTFDHICYNFAMDRLNMANICVRKGIAHNVMDIEYYPYLSVGRVALSTSTVTDGRELSSPTLATQHQTFHPSAYLLGYIYAPC